MKWRLASLASWVMYVALTGALAPAAGCGRIAEAPEDDPRLLTIKLTSSAFADGGMIPKIYTCDGEDRSPPLAWSGAPSGARSLALTCDDPDAPSGTWSHWVLFNVLPQIAALSERLARNDPVELEADLTARQGKNDFGSTGYGGPCPPRGTHRYVFRLFALDAMLDAKAGEDRRSLLKAVRGHVLAEGKLTGKYSR